MIPLCDMILGFDIGNTSTTAGLYVWKSIVPLHTFRFETNSRDDAPSLYKTIMHLLPRGFAQKNKPILGIAISSVVKEIVDAYCEMAENHFGISPFIVSHKSDLSFRMAYDHPEMLGPDRIANATAAHHFMGNNCIIIDMGTASTVTVLNDGAFVGGIIAPGVETAARALLRNTSMLVDVPISAPPSIIGNNTGDCIRSGLFFGWLSMIEGFVAKIAAELRRDFQIVVTGGHSKKYAGYFNVPCTIDPLFTMKGIKILYDGNHR